MICNFAPAYAGNCTNEKPCKEHDSVMCPCGKKAIGQCDMAVSMVCGRPTCQESLVCHGHDKPDAIVW